MNTIDAMKEVLENNNKKYINYLKLNKLMMFFDNETKSVEIVNVKTGARLFVNKRSILSMSDWIEHKSVMEKAISGLESMRYSISYQIKYMWVDGDAELQAKKDVKTLDLAIKLLKYKGECK